MNFTELTVQLLLIFLPGIVASIIINNLTTHKKPDFKFFIIYSFILGVLSYMIFYFLILFNKLYLKINGFESKTKLTFIKVLTNNETSVNVKEIIFTTIIAFLLALLISFIINKGWFHIVARKLNITKQFGEKDVWQFLFNSRELSWISVRDFDTNMVYQGYVAAFSDTHKENELLIQDVYVYDGRTGSYLYDLNALYITREKSKLTIEIQKSREEE